MSTIASPESTSIQSSLRFAALIIAMASFLAMAFVFHPSTGWNVNTRLNFIFAVVDRGTLKIDEFHDMAPYDTGDKAYFGGHYYSDKPFGVSALALPVYAIARTLNGGSLEHRSAHLLAKIFAVALPGAIAAALFFLLLARTGTPPKRAVIVTAFAVFGTMWYGYSSIFMPYAPAFACLFGALYLVLFPPAKRLTAANTSLVAFLAGYAVLCDLLFAPLAGAISLVWFARLLDQAALLPCQAFADSIGVRNRVKDIPGYFLLYTLIFLIPISFFFAYCYTIFGDFSLPYKYEPHEEFREGMSQGLFGITTPRFDVMYFITIHPYRGLFLWSPILVLALLGCLLALAGYGKRRLFGWLGLGSFAVYLYVNSSYYMWWGGWSMGPRHLLPAIPFMALGLGELVRSDRLSNLPQVPFIQRFAFPVVVFVGALSLALTLPLSLYDPQLPQGGTTEQINAQLDGEYLPIPQYRALELFYSGVVTLNPTTRFDGSIFSENRLGNYLSLFLFLAVIGGILGYAWKIAPSTIKETTRLDFPSNTVDGRAAFIPGRK